MFDRITWPRGACDPDCINRLLTDSLCEQPCQNTHTHSTVGCVHSTFRNRHATHACMLRGVAQWWLYLYKLVVVMMIERKTCKYFTCLILLTDQHDHFQSKDTEAEQPLWLKSHQHFIPAFTITATAASQAYSTVLQHIDISGDLQDTFNKWYKEKKLPNVWKVSLKANF